ncbi:hypothetical protein ElyMa_001066400 [Elysia marginata]|uniref:Uncharacterized protein n=1 Tax=Elysia marginata TaxID=1093978 RepID=A0AAV4HRU6_9GAST|nr:hypothetical protein ElyMa_001066400 [Elysia marginata]
MKRSCDEPNTSSGKRARPIRFTVQQVMDALADSDANEAEFHQEYYDNSSSDDDFDSDRASDDEDGGRSRGRPSVMGGQAGERIRLGGWGLSGLILG